MPVNLDTTLGQGFIIPEDVASIRVQLFGAGGGGEFVNQINSAATAGTTGGNTSFMGLVAGGGQGGGIGGKASGGAGGTNQDTFNWSFRNVTVTSTSGGSGGLNAAGPGAAPPSTVGRDGGAGTSPQVTFLSTVTHFFNNSSNTHTLTDNSPDIVVGFEGSSAADGLSCTPNYGKKYYSIRFVVPYDNASYGLTIFNVSNTTAGGGSGSNSLAGTLNQTNNGFDAWFCRNGNFNTYVRSFTVQTTGTRSALAGRGGGGGGYMSATFTRQNLIDSYTYRPGTSHDIVVGTGGTAGGNTSSAGMSGRAIIYMLIEPRITLSLDRSPILRGESTTLRWTITGDADTATIIQGDNTIAQGTNLNSNITVNPTSTTTFTVTASGLGGFASKEITLVVYEPPTTELVGPPSINYGEQVDISYEATHVDISLTVTKKQYYRDNTSTTTNISLPIGLSVSGTFPSGIDYTTKGPSSVEYTLTAMGNGGQSSKTITFPVNIDETPDNLLIPSTDDAIKNQDPVITPDIDVTTYEITINDIDIPVEVRSDKPIQVDIDDQDDWKNVRNIN